MAAKLRKLSPARKRISTAGKRQVAKSKKMKQGAVVGNCSCCSNNLPSQLTATASLSFGGVPFNLTIQLNRIAGTQQWRKLLDLSAYLPTCTVTLAVDFVCDGTNSCNGFYLNAGYINWCGGVGASGIRPVACACNPLNVQFQFGNFDPCCLGVPGTGSVTVTV